MNEFLKITFSVLLMFGFSIPSKVYGSDGLSESSAGIPSRIESTNTLRMFFSNAPQFKCNQTGVKLTLTYNSDDGFIAYVDDKPLGKFEVDTRGDRPKNAIIGLPWLSGWGPAPMILYLNGNNTYLALIPVQGEENLSYNSRGYLQHGRTGNTTWMQLSLSSAGVSFTPVDYKPDPEIFQFIGFSAQKYSMAEERRKDKKRREAEEQLRQKTIKEEANRLKIEYNEMVIAAQKSRNTISNEKNPLVTFIRTFDFTESMTLECGYGSNPSPNYNIIVKGNKNFTKCNEKFWRGMMDYIDPSTLKIREEYAIDLKWLLSALYIENMNTLLQKIDFRKGEGNSRDQTIYSYVPRIGEKYIKRGKTLSTAHQSLREKIFSKLKKGLKRRSN